MTRLVEEGSEIEGRKTEGKSRNPLNNRGLTMFKKKPLFSFVAKHNAESKLKKELKRKQEPISEKSAKKTGDCLLGETISCYSTVEKFKHSVEVDSAKHKTNRWVFKKHTLCKITKPRAATINSIRNRIRASKTKIDL